MKKHILFKRIVSLFLAVVLFLHPLFGVVVLAQSEGEPTPVPSIVVVQAENQQTDPLVTPTSLSDLTQSEITPTQDPLNQATAESTQTTEVTNNDTAQVDNNVNSDANTGGNTIIDPTPVPTSIPEAGQSPTPTLLPINEELLTLTPTETDEPLLISVTPSILPEDLLLTITPTLIPLEIVTDTIIGATSGNIGGLAENSNNGSENTAVSSSENQAVANNNNDATVVNFSEATSDTGNNNVVGKDSEIVTENAQTEANVVNFVNTNLVGADFWQLVINMFATNDNEINLTNLEGFQSFDPALISVLAKNDMTGDGSVNIALANILSSYAVYNSNTAQVTNNVIASANTGDNQVEGKRSDIQTGNATTEANVFNLVNTNLTGNSWFFGMINLFKQQNGDIVLPYELQYLLGENFDGDLNNVFATNQNTGGNSQNIAQATSTDSVSITNNNDATITNNVDASSNSGNNSITGKDSSINTGNAQAMVNLMNVINTNITGSHWLMLAVNNYGSWTGDILGWWGNKITVGNTTYIWFKMPEGYQPGTGGAVGALNVETGNNSQNQAVSVQINSLGVSNNNMATVENNVNVTADSGNNNIVGKDSSINTGDAKASVNIANVVNTNIIGNNWFFGVINIFGDFLGNIVFPRPDLVVIKTANKSYAPAGEEIIYTIAYKDIGRLWAKNVNITDLLPAGLTFISSSNGGSLQGGNVILGLNKIDSGSEGNFQVITRINPDITEGTIITNCANINTTTNEPEKSNNQSCASILVSKNPPTPTPTSGNGGSQPTPTPTEGNGIGGVEDPSGTTDFTNYSNNSNGGGGSSNACVLPEAPKAPTLLSIDNISLRSVRLIWTKVDRANYYLISYGTTSGYYLYGNSNVGDVNSYEVGELDPNKNYFFVVSAGISGSCPVAGLNSNELSNKYHLSSILGVQTVYGMGNNDEESFGEIDGGISTETGEVAGASNNGVCPFWWIALAGQTLVLGGAYGFLLKIGSKTKLWWLAAPVIVLGGFLADRYAHTNWYSESKFCSYEPFIGAAVAGLETIGFKVFKKK